MNSRFSRPKTPRAHVRQYAPFDLTRQQRLFFRPDRATARRDIENWIKSYNERRLHSSLGY